MTRHAPLQESQPQAEPAPSDVPVSAGAAPPEASPELVTRLSQILFGAPTEAPQAPGSTALEVAAARQTGGVDGAPGSAVRTATAVTGNSVGGSITHKDIGGKDALNTVSSSSARVDAAGLTVAHSRQLRSEKDQPLFGAGAQGTLAVTDDGVAVSGAVSGSVGGVTVSRGGGYVVKASVVQPPRGQAGPWLVRWSRTVEEKGGAGVRGGTMGIEAGKSELHAQHGELSFATEAQAVDFAERGGAYLAMVSPTPRDPGTALTMRVGEMRGETVTDGTRGGLSLTSGAATFGLAGGHDASQGVQIARIDGQTFHVTLSVGELRSGSASAGVPLVTFGITGSVAENETVTVAVDLTTPEGLRAYEDLVNHRKLGRAAQIVARSWRETERSGQKIELPLASSRVDAVVERSVAEADGHKLESAKGAEVEAHSIGAFGVEFGGHHNASTGLRTTERDDRQRSYLLEASVDSTDGRLSHEALARATGTFVDRERPRRSSGRWSIGAEIAEADMDAFVATATSEHFARGELGTRAGVADDLREALLGAKTSDERREALARFTADGGPQALEVIEHRIGEARGEPGFHFEHDLALAGDPNFAGTAGRLELEAQLGALREGAASNDPAALRALVARCGQLDAAQRARRGAIGNHERYTDLPDQLRARELARTDGALAEIAAIRRQAEVAVLRDAPDVAADERAVSDAEEMYRFYQRKLMEPGGAPPRGHWVHSAQTAALVREARTLAETAAAHRAVVDGARHAVVAGGADPAQLRAQLEMVRQLYARAGEVQAAAVEQLQADSGVVAPAAAPAPAKKRRRR